VETSIGITVVWAEWPVTVTMAWVSLLPWFSAATARTAVSLLGLTLTWRSAMTVSPALKVTV
jgi:hypothetical protein